MVLSKLGPTGLVQEAQSLSTSTITCIIMGLSEILEDRGGIRQSLDY